MQTWHGVRYKVRTRLWSKVISLGLFLFSIFPHLSTWFSKIILTPCSALKVHKPIKRPLTTHLTETILRGNIKKNTSIFTDIIQIVVDPPPSYPFFDKSIFDTVLIMLTSLPPLEFLTKIMK